MRERLISEPIRPVLDEAADRETPIGEPVLPHRFVWRGEEHTIADVMETWKEYSQGSAAMPDRYLRKHWYRIRTTMGCEMKLYFERKPRSLAQAKQRWWLFSVAGED
jgi:hypothetical protein